MYGMEIACMAWKLHVWHGNCMYDMETACMAWKLHVWHGDCMYGMETAFLFVYTLGQVGVST